MEHYNYNTENRKHKHLNYKERHTIEIRLKDGYTPYRIAKELNRPINTVLNEIKRGTVDQIVTNKGIQIYLADAGQAYYEKSRKASKTSFKNLHCNDFIVYVVDKVTNKNWSLDSCFGRALLEKRFPREEMVCTKTLYNYVHLCLMSFTVSDLPLILRRNNKSAQVRNQKIFLGKSIEERPEHIDTREEFGHWEIDTVIGQKSKEDEVIMSLIERQTRNAIFVKIPSKSACAINSALNQLRETYGSKFNKVFKTITSDNGREFSELSSFGTTLNTDIYFAHPYASYERGTNERHNGLLRRFLPKGKAISHYDNNAIIAIEEWMNTLPRKILGYKTPEELFDAQLDVIYAA